VLAWAGLLDGRQATTHWRLTEALARDFPRIDVREDVLYVDTGSIITSAGSATGMDMMLHMVRKDYGARVANLVAERLVTVVNQKGYRVAPMSEQELLDIFDARANMEAMLVRLAIERGGDEWEAELLARAHLLNKLESCEASEHLLDEWDQRHQAFHTAIVAGCGSQYLLQMRERLFDLAARYRFIWLRTTVLSVEMLEDKHVQHQTLVDAILARDAEQASALMREHLLTPIPIIQQAMAGKLSPQAG